MIYDLVEVEQKTNKKRIFFIIFLVAIILLSGATGILLAKNQNQTELAQKQQEEFLLAENEIPEVVKKEELPIQEKTDLDKTEKINKMEQVEKRELNWEMLNKNNLTEKGIENIANIYHTEEKTVYLTFDDGPSKTVTPLLLDLLKQENIKATFFLLGSRVEYYPDIVKREYEEGHYIANHGYSHLYKSIYQNPESVINEYNQTEDVIRKALGNPEYSSHLFRFPGGSNGGRYADVKEEAKSLLEKNGIAYVDWNALSQDSAGAKTKESLIENTIQTIGDKNCVVILMHDAGDKILTYETLPDIIAYLREKGYTFKNFYSVME